LTSSNVTSRIRCSRYGSWPIARWSAADIAILVASIGVFAVFLLLSDFLQQALRHSPVGAEAAVYPHSRHAHYHFTYGLGPGTVANRAPTALAITGMLLAGGGLSLLPHLGSDSS
jgi:hypothetical protein